MRASLIALTAGLFTTFAPIAASADTALLIVNDRYRNAQNLRQGAEVEQLRARLEDAGFTVISVADGSGEDMREGLDRLLSANETERVLVAVVGHFARSRTDSWLLASDVDDPSLATVGGDGLSLSVLMEAAASAPGRTFVLLGIERRRITLGDGLGAGVGRVDPPQGVTVVAGSPEDVADFARSSVLVPGTDMAAALDAAQGVRAFGFVSSDLAYLPAIEAAPAPTPQPQTQPPVAQQPDESESALWAAAIELDTVGAYRAYLNRYPNGFHVTEARARIDAFENDPETIARSAEEALNLTRDQRQEIQRSLSILDYDTRGIDGIFGTGTRTAIRGWQTAQGVPVTGYLDGPQINTLGQQARVRAAELEEEARIAREERDRADRAYWQVTGQGASDEGLRAYLERYPDGIYAQTAEDLLRAREAAARSAAEAADRAAWDVARGADTVASYQQYLSNAPNGAFRDQAQARINQLTGGGDGFSAGQIAQLQAQEAALNLPPVTRSLIEQRLAALGLEPGRIDGRYDDQTRRAIRRYQRARGLDVTGFLNQPTVVRLLAETVGGILQIDGVINR